MCTALDAIVISMVKTQGFDHIEVHVDMLMSHRSIRSCACATASDLQSIQIIQKTSDEVMMQQLPTLWMNNENGEDGQSVGGGTSENLDVPVWLQGFKGHSVFILPDNNSEGTHRNGTPAKLSFFFFDYVRSHHLRSNVIRYRCQGTL